MQATAEQGSLLGVGFTPDDISKLREYTSPNISILKDYSSNENFFFFAEAGDKRYALVITDSEKAKQFFNQNGFEKIKENYNKVFEANKSKMSIQENAYESTKAIIGDSNKSGISLYGTNDKKKENFVKL